MGIASSRLLTRTSKVKSDGGVKVSLGLAKGVRPLAQQTDPFDVAAVPATAEALAYSTEDSGEEKTTSWRRHLTQGGGKISFWHDVPLSAQGKLYHAVIEIPRLTTAKMEMATTEGGACMKQDTKKGKLRDYAIPIEWNYGAFPQTWEQPDHEWEGLPGHKGDNDPLDVVDLSTIRSESGAVIEVRSWPSLQ